MTRVVHGGLVLVALTALSACAPHTYTIPRMEWTPYQTQDMKQAKDGVTVELAPPLVPDSRASHKIPADFWVNVQACNARGNLLWDQGSPVMSQISVAINGQIWQPMSITNHTEHVLRLNYVVIRLFDPAGNQLQPMTRDELAARLELARPCPSSRDAVRRLRVLKIFDRNIEIVPRTTATVWVPFAAPSVEMSGVWRYTIYEIPVVVDDAGRTTRATHFDIRMVATKYVDTYRQEPLKPPVLVGSERDASEPPPQAPPPPRPVPPPPRATSPPSPAPAAAPSPPPAPGPGPGPPRAAPAPPPPPPLSQVTPPPVPPAAPAIRLLVVTVDRANVRAAADTKARILTVVTKGTRVTLLERGNQWYRVRLESGAEGWVAESVVAVVER